MTSIKYKHTSHDKAFSTCSHSLYICNKCSDSFDDNLSILLLAIIVTFPRCWNLPPPYHYNNMDVQQRFGIEGSPEEPPCRSQRSVIVNMWLMVLAQCSTLVLTVHVSFMLILNECIAARFPCPLVVDYVNLEEADGDIIIHRPTTPQ